MVPSEIPPHRNLAARWLGDYRGEAAPTGAGAASVPPTAHRVQVSRLPGPHDNEPHPLPRGKHRTGTDLPSRSTGDTIDACKLQPATRTPPPGRCENSIPSWGRGPRYCDSSRGVAVVESSGSPVASGPSAPGRSLAPGTMADARAWLMEGLALRELPPPPPASPGSHSAFWLVKSGGDQGEVIAAPNSFCRSG